MKYQLLLKDLHMYITNESTKKICAIDKHQLMGLAKKNEGF